MACTLWWAISARRVHCARCVRHDALDRFGCHGDTAAVYFSIAGADGADDLRASAAAGGCAASQFDWPRSRRRKRLLLAAAIALAPTAALMTLARAERAPAGATTLVGLLINRAFRIG